MGHDPRLMACLLTASPIIPYSAQIDPRRLFLPFDHHLRKITGGLAQSNALRLGRSMCLAAKVAGFHSAPATLAGHFVRLVGITI